MHTQKLLILKNLEKFVKVNAYFLVDMAHFSGLVAGGSNPVEYADAVTSTTHKVLKGYEGELYLLIKKN